MPLIFISYLLFAINDYNHVQHPCNSFAQNDVYNVCVRMCAHVNHVTLLYECELSKIDVTLSSVLNVLLVCGVFFSSIVLYFAPWPAWPVHFLVDARVSGE